MAEFKIHNLEGTRYVDIHLNHEMVRVEAGALSYLTGDISIHSRLIPSFGGLFKSMLADEAVYRPMYSGTGVITLESSLGGFHVLNLDGETWILERGSYWASEGSVDVSFYREKFLTSLWAGEGALSLQTRVRGTGQVALTTCGPIEEVVLEEGKQLTAQGKYVVGRTADVKYSIRRATKNYLGRFTSGEGFVRIYEGPGRVLLNPSPYWRYRIYTSRNGATPAKSVM